MTDTPNEFDPADYNADDVVAYIRDNPDQAQAILEAETAEGGKDRKTVREAAEEAIADADAANAAGTGDGDGPTDGDGAPDLPEGLAESRAATAQPTGDPSIDAPPYADSANPPEAQAAYYSTEVGAEQENLVAPGSGADTDPED